jgi:hypothetical protein
MRMDERPGDTDLSRDRAWQNSRGLGSWRVRTTAFGVAVAAHVLAILLYTSAMRVLAPDGFTVPVQSDTDPEQGVDVIQLIEVDQDDPEQPDEPEEIERLSTPTEIVRPPVVPGPLVGELVPPGPTAAERLRPNLSDARLWAEPPPEFYELTLEQREELLASARIVEWYDSVAAVQAAEDRLTDWTFRDGSGGRWGVADGKIYLGDIALPLPLNFGVPVGKRDETARRVWEFNEIERQSQQYLIDQNWKERAAAIRERRDRERATARGDTLGIR